MATSTVPGVKVTIVENFYSSNEATTEAFADRVLIVGRANEGVTAGWQAGTPTAYLYNPALYKSENEVINDFGLGSELHIAFHAAAKAGAKNIYLSAVDPNPYLKEASDIPTAVSDLYSGITLEEYEVYLGLEHASIAAPSVILLTSFDSNENIGGTRVSWAARILTDRCLTLTEEVNPCYGVVGVATLKEHYELANATTLTDEPMTLVGQVATVTTGTNGDWIRGTLTVTEDNDTTPTETTWDDIEAVDWVVGSVTFRDGYTPLEDIVVTVEKYGEFSDYYDASTVAEYISGDGTGTSTMKGLTLAAGAPTNTEEPFPIESVTEVVDPASSATGLSKYLVLVVGDVLIIGQEGATSYGEYQNAVSAVFGSIGETPLEDAITLRPIKNVSAVAYDLTKAQRLSLIQKYAVPVALSPRGLIVSVDGITQAIDDINGDTSVYSRLSTLRIAHEVTKGTRSTCEPFIGMQASTARLNSIETKLRGYYLALKTNGLAKEIRFEMKYSISTAKLTVYVTVIPYGEIREIDITVDVSLEG